MELMTEIGRFFKLAPRSTGPLRDLALAGVLLIAQAGLAQTVDRDDPPKYLGVVTCAGSTCHGAARPVTDSRVLQTEFLTWHREDQHAHAYRALQSEEGRAIARKLGLDNAATAPECLNCHANFVAEDRRGKRFQLTDGVGCETCHGPASKWLGLHVTGEASRDDNIQAGMVRTDDPEIRATLCLSCHLGGENKFASHRILGAGHPRLSFELDTFSILQPAHFQLDADYRERKQVTSH
ncbi:MAG: multiheme c-type cytochrome, partial [Gammaproteobacteria bacterium]